MATRGVGSNEAEELPPVQERAHALAISYKTSACMHKVNYITVTDLTRAINRDLMFGKRPAALITTFLQSVEGIYVPLTKCALSYK